MNSLPVRAGVLLLCLATSGGLLFWMRSRASGEVAKPTYKLSDFPMTLGDWQGQDLEMLPETSEVLKAHDHLDRTYEDALGRHIGLHIANWASPEMGTGAPHHPEVCYCNAGWEIIERSKSLVSSDAGDFPVEWILYEKDGRTVVTGHWYDLGPLTFTQTGDVGTRVMELWGVEQWPPTEKFLLQGDFGSIEAAKLTMGNFAALIRASMNEQRE